MLLMLCSLMLVTAAQSGSDNECRYTVTVPFSQMEPVGACSPQSEQFIDTLRGILQQELNTKFDDIMGALNRMETKIQAISDRVCNGGFHGSIHWALISLIVRFLPIFQTRGGNSFRGGDGRKNNCDINCRSCGLESMSEPVQRNPCPVFKQSRVHVS